MKKISIYTTSNMPISVVLDDKTITLLKEKQGEETIFTFPIYSDKEELIGETTIDCLNITTLIEFNK